MRVTRVSAGHEKWSRPEFWVVDSTQDYYNFVAAGKKAHNTVQVEGVTRTLPYRAGSADLFGQIEADACIRNVWTAGTADYVSQAKRARICGLVAVQY